MSAMRPIRIDCILAVAVQSWDVRKRAPYYDVAPAPVFVIAGIFPIWLC